MMILNYLKDYLCLWRLRGFESGKIGPKDGKDFIGGNFVTALNFNTNIPQLFPQLKVLNFILWMLQIYGV